MINVFIPHRWNSNDYGILKALLNRTDYIVRDYSVPKSDCFEKIDSRYNVDPQIKQQIKYATVVVCSNRPANSKGMGVDEIKYAISIGKPVVAVQLTTNTSSEIQNLSISIVPNRKDSLQNWIDANV